MMLYMEAPLPIPSLQGKEKESAARIKRFMTIMDSMTDKELDCPNPKLLEEPSRMLRLARGSGSHPAYVGELLGVLLVLGVHALPIVTLHADMRGAARSDFLACMHCSLVPSVQSCPCPFARVRARTPIRYEGP